MGTTEDLFKDAVDSTLDELLELVQEMKDDGINMADEVHRLANEVEKIWAESVEHSEAAEADEAAIEDEELEEGETTA